ncbi:hypothetical protein [Paenibacillus campi]|uniref:hypothetical protein n=1 Tax=Paenibacillus campi TaxID=3106031 RepID=UPI002AFDD582|nr:hypothetical protein [Paenibacillus sp. SGZ-1014]
MSLYPKYATLKTLAAPSYKQIQLATLVENSCQMISVNKSMCEHLTHYKIRIVSYYVNLKWCAHLFCAHPAVSTFSRIVAGGISL